MKVCFIRKDVNTKNYMSFFFYERTRFFEDLLQLDIRFFIIVPMIMN